MRKILKAIKKNLRRTYKNKLCAIALIIIGFLPIYIENDATVLVVSLMIGIPLFFSKQNHIC